MPTYMVSYDLKTQGKDYSALVKALQEGYRNYWHCLGSTWLIVADQNHTQVRDYLVQHIDTNDRLIVADLGGNAAWHGFSEECSNWITNNLRTYPTPIGPGVPDEGHLSRVFCARHKERGGGLRGSGRGFRAPTLCRG